MDTVAAPLDVFLRQYAGTADLPPAEADLFDALGIEGDDAFAFITEFGRRFDVDLEDYRLYFHHGEEGWNLGGLVFKPPYGRVNRIPISIALLEKAIAVKRWPVTYPAHSPPR